MKKNSDQKIRNATEYGSIIAISVPTPAFGTYRATKAMIIRAFRTGEASFVAPFDYSKLLFATVFGFIFFGERPDAWTWVGAAIIISATLYIARREAQLHRPAEKSAALAPARFSEPALPGKDQSTLSVEASR